MIEDKFNINGKLFKNTITLTLIDNYQHFNFKAVPSEIENLKKSLIEDLDLAKIELRLKESGFVKKDGLWNYDIVSNLNKQYTIPKYAFRNGNLIFKFGKVNIGIIIEDGLLDTDINLPRENVPSYNMLTRTFEKRLFSIKGFEDYQYKHITLPLYKANSTILDKFFSKEYSCLDFDKFDIDFINWYIDDNIDDNSKLDYIYSYYNKCINKLINKLINAERILEYELPKGFLKWEQDNTDGKFYNYRKSLTTNKKYKL